jgi:8-oxo-dGTP pyrophosphatase MutT (NUDIX family)
MSLVQDKDTEVFTTDDLRRRATGVLIKPRQRITGEETHELGSSDFKLNPDLVHLFAKENERRQAAVVVPVIERKGEATVLLTKRSESLPTHAGQISFPGGKVDPSDANVIETAFREAHEEVGLEAEFIDPVGFMNDYLTGTGFCIAPLVAVVREGFTITPDHKEVDDVFEVPLGFLMNARNHEIHTREWRGAQRLFYAMLYEERFIWGATAGILRMLYENLYSAGARQ